MICSLQSNGESMGPSDLLSQGNFLCRSAFLLSGSVGWGARAFVFRLGRNRPDPCFNGTLCPESAYACRLRERNPMTLSLKSRMVRHPGSNLWMSIFAVSFIDVLQAGLPNHVFILRDQYGIPVRGTAKTSSVGSNALK